MIEKQKNDLASNILVVDDNPANLRFLTEVLEKEGYVVRPVSRGSHALVAAQTEPPDLILLDIMMPEMSGYEVCEHLKAEERTHAIPIIFISAKDEVFDKVKAFSVGGVDYITKPFQLEEVLERVKTHVTLWHLQKHLQEKNVRLKEEIKKRECSEQKIRHLNAELEELVQQRTTKLEAANKELRNFVYVASHDLKTPLRGISQIAYWVLHDYAEAFDDPGKEMMHLLRHRVNRMDRLIDGILQYARIERITEKDEEIALEAFVLKIIKRLSPPQQIRIVIEQELPGIVANSAHIKQIFHHLIRNAIQWIDKPEGDIMIGCVDNGDVWTFSVADNGPGIAEKYHEKIFQIFQTLLPHDEWENIGIGLALVKKIVELYGGKIWIESQNGAGSVFRFTFPKHMHDSTTGRKHEELRG